MTSILKRNAAFTAHSKPVTGDIKMSFINYDHIGWLKCDGRQVSVNDFNLLFQVIGYTFGGSGNSFNLPNTFGKILGSVNNIYPPGTDIGSATHTLTINELPAHNHGTQTNTSQPVGNFELTGNSATGITTNIAGGHTHSGITDTAGSHTHTSNAIGGQGNPGLAIADGTNTVITTDSSLGELNVWTTALALTIDLAGDHTHNFITASAGNHTHDITDPTHNHLLQSIGNNEPHNNIQPTLFIGNTFIYSGIPVYPGFPPNPNSAWPFTVGLQPPMI